MASETKKSEKPTRKWTSAQSDAIYDEGGTLLISAAAGSGKTAVLVERAVHMMTREQTRVQADKLLIVTFTRAAAQELRGRINSRLAKQAVKKPQNINLKRQKMLLGKANICTIDAFCMQLLQRYFEKLGLPANFTVADEATIFELKNSALGKTLDAMYKRQDFCNFASMYGRAKNDSTAAKTILALYDFARSTENPHKTLAEMCADYAQNTRFSDTIWGKELLQNALVAAQNALKLTRTSRDIILQEQELLNYDLALSEDESFYTRLCELLQQSRWDDAQNYTAQFSHPGLKAVKNCDSTSMETIKSLRNNAKKITEELKNNIFICTEAEFESDNKFALPSIIALVDAVKMFENIFFELKIEQKMLEYSDFEHLTIKLLCDENGNKTAVAKIINASIDTVMVDEYQDTNAIQSKIYSLLANDDKSNLFFVGDVKQSIYRFRLANPEIFIDKREKFTRYDAGKVHPSTIILGHNFRSAKNVINQINDVFSCIMSKKTGDVEYNESEMLKPGIDSDFDGGALSMKFVDISNKEAQNTDVGVVAATIKHMVNTGYEVRAEGGAKRPCKYDDFCILLRTRGKFALYEAELSKLSIPSFADTSESFLTSSEVSSAIALLRVIDNPGRDIDMAATLLSALFNFTPDDILKIRSEYPNGRLYTSLLHSKQDFAVDFCNELAYYRTLAATKPVDELLTQIFARTHYFSAASAMENGLARRENLRLFTSFIKGSMQSGLSAVLRRIDSAIQSNASHLGSAAPSKGSVSIMTIHRSKGLEFPVCILADATHGFNTRELSNPILFHPKMGIGMKLRNENAGGIFQNVQYAAITCAQRREALSEEMRVLYVALTRAKDKLIVTLPMKNPEKVLTNLTVSLLGAGKADDYLLSKQQSLGAWLSIFALLHPNCDNLRKLTGGATLPLISANGTVEADIVPSKVPEISEKIVQFEHTAQPDLRLLEDMLTTFDEFEMRDNTKSKLPVKLSVSEISHAQRQTVLARPAFMYKEGLTAAERGTAQHEFLQFADFKRASEDLSAEIDRLVKLDYLNADLAKKLPQNSIKAFLGKEVASRIQNADEVKREYDFITTVPAKFVYDDISTKYEEEPIQVQGIADVVIINNGGAEIIDYKTDRNKTNDEFVKTYSKQLGLYKLAIEKKLNIEVTACTIYSFANEQEINVPI